jgi:hypothetical protein
MFQELSEVLYMFTHLKLAVNWVLVGHACNPSYSGGGELQFKANLGK